MQQKRTSSTSGQTACLTGACPHLDVFQLKHNLSISECLASSRSGGAASMCRSRDAESQLQFSLGLTGDVQQLSYAIYCSTSEVAQRCPKCALPVCLFHGACHLGNDDEQQHRLHRQLVRQQLMCQQLVTQPHATQIRQTAALMGKMGRAFNSTAALFQALKTQLPPCAWPRSSLQAPVLVLPLWVVSAID